KPSAASAFWSATTAAPLSPSLSIPLDGSVASRLLAGELGCVPVGVVAAPPGFVRVVSCGVGVAACGVDREPFAVTPVGTDVELPPPEVATTTTITATTAPPAARAATIRRRA